MIAMSHRTGGTVLCLASYEKGQAFMRAMHELGWHVILLTKETLAGGDWPHDSLEDVYTIPTLQQTEPLLEAATGIARSRRIDRVVGVDDFDITTAAEVREFLGLRGMRLSTARRWKDKLAMRIAAREAGVRQPPFVPFIHGEDVSYFLDQTEGPWILKPRGYAGSVGMRTSRSCPEVTGWFEELGTRSAAYVLETFIPGDVHHVDGIVRDGRPVFAQAHAYGRPPLDIVQHGGVFTTRTMRRESTLSRQLIEAHHAVVGALGLEDGVTHAEFIVDRSGVIWFLEAACRVGGAFIANMVEHSTGIDLWREWARLEVREPGEPYAPEATRKQHAGVAVCLARESWPDLEGYDDPEIVERPRKQGHAAIVVAGRSAGRIERLLAAYSRRFEEEFLMVLPPLERPAA